jgi:hypothetical protein
MAVTFYLTRIIYLLVGYIDMSLHCFVTKEKQMLFKLSFTKVVMKWRNKTYRVHGQKMLLVSSYSHIIYWKLSVLGICLRISIKHKLRERIMNFIHNIFHQEFPYYAYYKFQLHVATMQCPYMHETNILQ